MFRCRRLIRPAELIALGAVIALALTACGGSGDGEPSSDQAEPTTETLGQDTESAQVQGSEQPEAASGETPLETLPLVPVTIDLGAGPNRFAFAIIGENNVPIRVPDVTITYVSLSEEQALVEKTAKAVFRQWPTGHAGVYVTDVLFDHPGPWGILAEIAADDGSFVYAQTAIQVMPESSAPGIGAPAPASANRTASSVTDLAEITSALTPDPDLYRITIADAIASGLPTLVTFVTPAFCQTATCGPQLEVVSNIKNRHKSEANYIHIEVYENLDEMAGDITKGRINPVMEEWGLLTEPVTFIIDTSGLVVQRYEGFVNEEELEAALVELLSAQ